MLRELHISNLAVIEDARLELGQGLNCFTGQTGAGKSLVLGAIEALLGLRPVEAGQMLRAGCAEGRVSGVFELRDPALRQQVAAAADLTIDGDELLITRKLFASGRSSASINGQPATAAMVRAVGDLLVDIHGQHDHQYLLKPANQLYYLDRFGDSLDARRRYGELHEQARQLRQRYAELSASQTLRGRQLELYEFQAQEIDAARLVEGEFAQAQARHTLLSNLARLQRDAGAAHAALYEADGSIVERLQAMAHLLGDLEEIDPRLKDTAQQVRAATVSLQDAAFELGRYVDRLDVDPVELSELEDRLNTINRLIAKYGKPAAADPVAELLACRDTIEKEIVRLRSEDQDLSSLTRQIDAAQTERELVGRQLTKARRSAAEKLRPLVEAQFRELGLADAEFSVEFEPDHDSASGADRIEMMARINPGQPARPLRKTASGGELSRIMLALESILADNDRVSVLVFDEIDANVGGRMGTVIGQKLRQLASQPVSGRSGAHQVLCITHLPQIAAFADRHLKIAKSVTGKGADRLTRTTVTLLEGEARVAELADMLAGKQASPTTRRQARELLAAAG